MPVSREPVRMNAQQKHGNMDASKSRKGSALACTAACGAASVRHVKRAAQKRSAVNRPYRSSAAAFVRLHNRYAASTAGTSLQHP